MTTPEESRPQRVPLRRLGIWLLIAAALVVGVAFYFRFGREIAPVLGAGS